MPEPSFDPTNERTLRHEMWRRYEGREWEAFDQLPPLVRQRVTEHAYDAWSVNVLMLWKHYKRVYGRTMRAERALIRYLDYCERLEREAFGARYSAENGRSLPHDAAAVPVLRMGNRSLSKARGRSRASAQALRRNSALSM
ncbi:DUF6525 family protein [Acetobacteraceae bacterium LMG 32668]|uniref:DUF6525 family protein n=1 Tax=Brytella acorum TaxID=2959299 RepID=A0AA35V7X1_9PROT|nr:DUF6525 family protein [Brytella acorum]MDF3625638.1 DUF6525 family protein [Brytella acorum]CAI9119503.1 DUF6525 family protein [Brytella acorum]